MRLAGGPALNQPCRLTVRPELREVDHHLGHLDGRREAVDDRDVVDAGDAVRGEQHGQRHRAADQHVGAGVRDHRARRLLESGDQRGGVLVAGEHVAEAEAGPGDAGEALAEPVGAEALGVHRHELLDERHHAEALAELAGDERRRLAVPGDRNVDQRADLADHRIGHRAHRVGVEALLLRLQRAGDPLVAVQPIEVAVGEVVDRVVGGIGSPALAVHDDLGVGPRDLLHVRAQPVGVRRKVLQDGEALVPDAHGMGTFLGRRREHAATTGAFLAFTTGSSDPAAKIIAATPRWINGLPVSTIVNEIHDEAAMSITNLGSVTLLIAIAEAKSLAAAAHRLGLSPSAVSKALTGSSATSAPASSAATRITWR